MTEPERKFMERAIELAKRGGGWVNPNPQVGCVIVKDDKVIGEGWHTRFGCLHAEREALADCCRKGNDPRGAIAYVTLEPCNHTGKTPPCTDALIEAGISSVIIGSDDPNPQVSGRGIDRLREAGISVTTGFMKDECEELNQAFFHYITTKRPYVIAKYAMTLDGKIATRSGKSKWITGSDARTRVHSDRTRYSAIMVGIGTVLADDPMLTARMLNDASRDFREEVHQPAHIVADSNLSIPLESNIVLQAKDIPTYVLTTQVASEKKITLENLGVNVIVTSPTENGRVDLSQALGLLGDFGIDSIIVEGGAMLLGSLFDLGLVDFVQAYIAPKIFGGAGAPNPIAGIGVEDPSASHILKDVSFKLLGDDMLVEGRLR